MLRTVLTLAFAGACLFSFSLFVGGVIAQSSADSGRQALPQPTPSPTATPYKPVIKEDDTVYKVDTELVNINVRVVDRNNRPISGLNESDLNILEDGQPQKIEFFSKSEVPTNYSLVIDNSGSLRTQIDQVIEASKILVANNRPKDETSIIRFVSSDKIRIEQEFTADKNELNDALDNMFIEGGQTAIIDAVYLAASRVTEYEKSSDKDDRKRRAIVLVTDGEDKDSFYKEPQLFDLLKETDVQIYVVGFVNELDKQRGLISKSVQSKAKTFLEKLATATGGRAYFPNSIDELNGIARDIADELRIQYSIGYIPSNEKADGTFRNIKVNVVDGPNGQKRIAVTKAGRTADGGFSPGGTAAPATAPKKP